MVEQIVDSLRGTNHLPYLDDIAVVNHWVHIDVHEEVEAVRNHVSGTFSFVRILPRLGKPNQEVHQLGSLHGASQTSDSVFIGCQLEAVLKVSLKECLLLGEVFRLLSGHDIVVEHAEADLRKVVVSDEYEVLLKEEDLVHVRLKQLQQGLLIYCVLNDSCG